MRLQRILFFCFILVFALLFHSSVLAKSYYFPEVKIEMNIDKDGSIDVTEDRTFSFSGSFSKIYWDIPLKSNQNITDVQISESNIVYIQIPYPDESRPEYKFVVTQSGGVIHIEAYHKSADAQKNFTLKYRLGGAITKYQDVSELYWKVVGSGWDARIDNLYVKTHLPEAVDKNEIYVWGHGPLNGQSEILNGQEAQFTVRNVPARTFVEIRELFPSNIVEGVSIGQPALERVKREETDFQTQTRMSEGFKATGIIFVILVGIGWFVFWLNRWEKYGKEYDNISIPKYLQFPPDKLAPALVEALVSQNQSITPNSFSATILDLARRKVLKIEVKQTLSSGFLGLGGGWKYEYTLRRKANINSKLLADFEQSLLDFIFSASEDPKAVSIEDLKDYMKSHTLEPKEFFDDWGKKVKKSADDLGFIEPQSKKWMIIFIVSNILFLIFIYVLLLFLGVDPGFTVILVAGIFGIALVSRFYLRWTGEAGQKAKQWLAFKRYIKDFGHFENTIPQAVTIWEEILVYGTALGLATTVAKYLPMILRQVNPNTYVGWYVYSAASGSSGTSISGMDVSPITGLTESFSSMSSAFSKSFSSGHGGGFSGGGGGGGGGGGAS